MVRTSVKSPKFRAMFSPMGRFSQSFRDWLVVWNMNVMTFHILGTPYIFQGSFILYDPNSAWWFGTMEFYGFPETVGNIIIPTDELSYFSGGRYTTNQLLIMAEWRFLNMGDP